MRKFIKVLALMLATVSVVGCVAGCNNSGEASSSLPSSDESVPSEDTPIVSPIHPADTVYVDAVKSKDYAAISESVKYTTYYFDAENGLDSNSGTSVDAPKKTLDAANTIVEEVEADVPTKLLFKAGATFEGTLELESYYAKEAPL